MTNYRKAPKLYHEGSKPKGNFYQLPHALMNAVFQKFDGKNGNAIKLLVVLIGSAGDGSFALSEKMIEKRTGISKQNYHRTMDNLVALGYVTRENGKVILNLSLLMEAEDDHDDDQESHRQTETSTHDDEIRQLDDDYNRKRIKNNKKSLEKDLAVDENEKRIENTLKRIGIDYAANTKKSITTMIGEEPQAGVLDELVRRNFPVLEKAKNEPQAYRYGILKELLQTEYHGLKLKLEAERAEQERLLEESRKYPPSLLEDCFRRAEASRHEEGIGDISELLVNFFEDEDDEKPLVDLSTPPASLQILEEMMRTRKKEQDDWDDNDDTDDAVGEGSRAEYYAMIAEKRRAMNERISRRKELFGLVDDQDP